MLAELFLKGFRVPGAAQGVRKGSLQIPYHAQEVTLSHAHLHSTLDFAAFSSSNVPSGSCNPQQPPPIPASPFQFLDLVFLYGLMQRLP